MTSQDILMTKHFKLTSDNGMISAVLLKSAPKQYKTVKIVISTLEDGTKSVTPTFKFDDSMSVSDRQDVMHMSLVESQLMKEALSKLSKPKKVSKTGLVTKHKSTSKTDLQGAKEELEEVLLNTKHYKFKKQVFIKKDKSEVAHYDIVKTSDVSGFWPDMTVSSTGDDIAVMTSLTAKHHHTTDSFFEYVKVQEQAYREAMQIKICLLEDIRKDAV